VRALKREVRILLSIKFKILKMISKKTNPLLFETVQ
jgi:hypothetical protein